MFHFYVYLPYMHWLKNKYVICCMYCNDMKHRLRDNCYLLYRQVPDCTWLTLCQLQRICSASEPRKVLCAFWIWHQAILLQYLSWGVQEGPKSMQLLPKGHLQWSGGLPCTCRWQGPVQGMCQISVAQHRCNFISWLNVVSLYGCN
jgi:hypothetical protein